MDGVPAMSDLNEFEERVKARLRQAEQRRTAYEEQVRRRTAELLERSQQFRQTADHLLQSVIRPRIEKVTAFLGNGELLPAEVVGRYRCASRFRPAGRFPSTTRLCMGLSHDGQFEQLLLLYDLEILPVPFPFESSDQHDLPRHAVDDERVIAWADERLLQFVDTYLRVKDGEVFPCEEAQEAIRFAA